MFNCKNFVAVLIILILTSAFRIEIYRIYIKVMQTPFVKSVNSKISLSSINL